MQIPAELSSVRNLRFLQSIDIKDEDIRDDDVSGDSMGPAIDQACKKYMDQHHCFAIATNVKAKS